MTLRLHTPRLVLRPVEAGDLATLLAIRNAFPESLSAA
jgi:hypothetical protein